MTQPTDPVESQPASPAPAAPGGPAGWSLRRRLIVGGLAGLVGVMLFYVGRQALDGEGDVPSQIAVPSDAAPASGGSGVITFGFGLDEQLQVETEDTTFAIGEIGSVSANFSEPIGATSVDVIVSSIDTAGAEAVVYSEVIAVDPSHDTWGIEEVEISALSGGSGDFVMRIYRDSTELAEGAFTVEP